MPQLIYFVVMLVLSYALQPKPPKPKPAAFEDFDFPTADDGTPQIVVFGDVWLTDWTVIGVGNFRNSPIKKSSGGLFSKSVTSGYKYSMSLLMGLCRGIDDLIEIKISDKTAWTGNLANGNKTTISINKPNLFGGNDAEGGIVGQLIIQKGAADQAVLPELAVMYNTPVPAYRGVVTFFYDGLVCSNSPYPKPWSFRVRRITSNWDGEIWYPAKAVISMNDDKIKAMNPAHIIYEAQTNRVWGRGFTATQLDTSSFQAAADQLYNEGFGLCLAWRRQESLAEFIQQIVDTIGAALFLDRLTGLWKLILIRQNYDASTLPVYNNGNGLLNIVDDNNAANDISSNHTLVTFRDPITNQDQQIRAENIASIQKYGVISETKTYSGIPTQALAGRVAARDMKIAQSSLKKFKLEFDRRAYQMQPMSVFKINAPEQGIESVILRAVRVEHSDITNGKITVTAMQDVFGLADQNFIGNQPNLHQPPISTALPVSNPLIYEVPFFELLQDFSTVDLQAKSGQGYLAVAAAPPTPLHISFDLLAKASSEVAYNNVGTSDFAFISSIADTMNQTGEAITCVLNDPVVDVAVGDRALLGSEIVRIDAIDPEANTVTLARGCIDTEPQPHAAGTKFYLYSGLTNAANRVFNAGQTANLKIITRTVSDELNAASATVYSAQLSNRLTRPYPPCQVRLNSEYFPGQTDVTNGLKIAWNHRNRLMQVGQAPSFTESSNVVEANTKYGLNIFDANNVKLMETLLEGNQMEFTWNVPKRFDGEMSKVLDIKMTGPNNSQAFTDASPNHFTVLNDSGVLIKTSSSAEGGSHACFDVAVLKTNAEYAKLDIYQQDHCIEFRVKTSPADALVQHADKFSLRVRHNREVGENIAIDYVVSLSVMEDQITIDVTGTIMNGSGGSTSKTIFYNATSLSPDTYYDIAIQCIDVGTTTIGGTDLTNGEISIFFQGNKEVSDVLHILSWGQPCSVVMQSYIDSPASGGVTMNGLRITKRAGGRYSGNYTPGPYIVGSSDSYWSDVVLLIPMTGSNGAHAFTDVSISPVALAATEAVTTKPDTNAHGGSSAHFYYPMLVVAPQPVLNLRDKSFVIEGRINGFGEIFQLTSSMVLSLNQYTLDLHNIFDSTPVDERQTVSVYHGYGSVAGEEFPRYVDFKIMRDAASGNTMLWINDLVATAQFNPAQTASTTLLLGVFDRDFLTLKKSYFNGFSIETVSEDAAIVPNVDNPVRVELYTERDGLKSNQAFSTEVTLI